MNPIYYACIYFLEVFPLGFPVHAYLQTLHSFGSLVITIFLLPHWGHRSCLPIYLTSLQPEFKRLALLSNNISF